MLTVGCHLSASDGFEAMGKTALSIGANTFAFFTRNPRGSGAKAISKSDTDALIRLMHENNFGKLVAHAPYTLNPCGADTRVREFAYQVLADDLNRMEYIPGNYYNFHPGSHVGQGAQEGIRLTAELLNDVLTPDLSTAVLIETMSGKGSEIGRTFAEVAELIARVRLTDKVGVCMDTCHIFDGGYDIKEKLDDVLNEFDREVGLVRLKAVHINDSMNSFSSHKDRHQKLGEGNLGIEFFSRFINHPAIRNLPMILETPNELDGYKNEIERLRELYSE